jgi:succinate-semialdehyde dehydrogenase/glutarate-semialdehyde dehydrogenase
MPAIGGELTSNPTVRKITFTGSTEIGKVLMRQSAETVKKMGLELGGNAPFIVFDDADLDAAVEGAIASKYRNNGQTCVCANRIYVQDAVYDAFAAKLSEKVKALKVGKGTDPGVIPGAAHRRQGGREVEEHVADALASAKLRSRRQAPRSAGLLQPTILTGVPRREGSRTRRPSGRSLFRFKDDADVIRQANDTEFGLASYSRDLARVWEKRWPRGSGRASSASTPASSPQVAPFGGVKQSGLGREGSRPAARTSSSEYLCMGASNKGLAWIHSLLCPPPSPGAWGRRRRSRPGGWTAKRPRTRSARSSPRRIPLAVDAEPRGAARGGSAIDGRDPVSAQAGRGRAHRA